jgi:hypothetical protein
MANLRIRVRDALRRPLDDRVDIEIRGQRTGKVLVNEKDRSAQSTISIRGLTSDEPYQLSVFPRRHRPVGEFLMVTPGVDRTIECFCPVHPDRVATIDCDEYGSLVELDRVLQQGGVEGFESLKGHALFDALSDLPKAGLLNLYAKMNHTVLPSGRTPWSYVQKVWRIRADRIYVHVEINFRDDVRSGVDANMMTKVSGALHPPPETFVDDDSFKSRDPHGNLQLTFFRSQVGAKFIVEADIDDANGFEHSFQVLRNWITGKTTHPYDIHEILVFTQELPMPYRLVV